MLNYIKAELYRTFNRKYFYFFIGILAVLAMSLLIFLKIVDAKNNISLIDAMGMSVTNYMMMLPVGLLVMLIDMIYTEEYKNGTLKNTVAFGMSRSKLIFGKFITIIILAFITDIVVKFVFWTGSALIFGIGHFNRIKPSMYFNIIATRYCTAVILWIAVIAVGLLLITFINNSNMFLYVYFGVFVVLPMTIDILSHIVDKNIGKINNFLITGCINLVGAYNGTNKGNVFWALAVGLVYIVICLSLSVVWFSKKDVK